jgi:hypothetical protein
MDLDTGIVLIGSRGGCVTEDHGSINRAKKLAGAGVIGGVESHGFTRNARGCHGFDDAQRRPWLLATWLEHDRRLQRQRGNPKRMHAR